MSLKKAKELGIDTFYKILREDLIHHEYKYKLGVNEDIKEFNPKGECESGGLYFVELNRISNWIEYGTKIATIKLDPEEEVWIENRKFKSHKFTITFIQTIEDFLIKNKYDMFEAVKQNGLALRYVKEQTNEICLEAVKQDEDAKVYVKE